MNEKIRLRPYRSEDSKEIMRLFRHTVHSINAIDYTHAQLDVWAPEHMDEHRWNKSFLEHYAIVAEQDGIIVGFGDIDDSSYLDRLYVHKDFQRQGIATRIVDELEHHALMHGTLTIMTHASMTAKPFFECRGYRVIRKQSVERQGLFLTNVVMEKKLT